LVLAALAQLAHHQTEVILFLRQLHPMVAAMAAATFPKTQIVAVLAAADVGMALEGLETGLLVLLVKGTLEEVLPVDKLLVEVVLALSVEMRRATKWLVVVVLAYLHLLLVQR